MANPAKRKGDNGEREAVAMLLELVPHLVTVRKPQRALGAGRREDEGDVWVFNDASIQIKTWANLTRALREAADGAARQQRNARHPFGVGMVPIPNAPKGGLRWLAVAHTWPGGLQGWEPIPTFGVTKDAVAHLRNGFGGRVPHRLRMVRVRSRGTKTLLVAPVEAWLECYAETTGRQLSPPPGFEPAWANEPAGELVSV